MNAAAQLVEVRVPDMGNFKDVAIIDVLVKPGDAIEPEAPLVTLETEKATMDVPSTVGGVVEKIHIAKGGTVSTGDLIVTVRSADGAGAPQKPSESASAPAAGISGAGVSGGSGASRPAVSAAGGSPAAASAATASGSAASAVGGSPKRASAGPAASGAGAPAQRPPRDAEPATTAPAAPRAHQESPRQAPASRPAAREVPGSHDGGAAEADAKPAPGARSSAGLAPINEPGFSRAHAGPSVRKFARELGVDLTQVTGHGFKGRVTHDDVKAFVKRSLGGAPAAASAGKTAPAPAVIAPAAGVPVIDFSQFGEVETRPLSRIQKISGPRLHASWVSIPHVTQFDEADITELEALRGKLKEPALKANIKLTPLAFILRVCVKALQEFPLFNSSLDPTGTNLIVKKYVHLGFAADTPNGLVVPVVRDANRKDVYEIARQLSELSEKARAGKLTAAEMQGGSFTISSLGGIGGTAFTPIINAPEVAILGVSRSAMRPVFYDGTFVPRLMLPLSLSYDHRVIDGATAVRFTSFLVQTLADPRSLTEAVP
jgi:pyruvate dehydrogenase E2 component (dihydrolipoamide acetyltransferase)